MYCVKTQCWRGQIDYIIMYSKVTWYSSLHWPKLLQSWNILWRLQFLLFLRVTDSMVEAANHFHRIALMQLMCSSGWAGHVNLYNAVTKLWGYLGNTSFYRSVNLLGKWVVVTDDSPIKTILPQNVLKMNPILSVVIMGCFPTSSK